MVLVTIGEDGVLRCNRCGTLEPDLQSSALKYGAWTHLLDAHRAECVAASCEAAVAQVEAMR